MITFLQRIWTAFSGGLWHDLTPKLLKSKTYPQNRPTCTRRTLASRNAKASQASNSHSHHLNQRTTYSRTKLPEQTLESTTSSSSSSSTFTIHVTNKENWRMKCFRRKRNPQDSLKGALRILTLFSGHRNVVSLPPLQSVSQTAYLLPACHCYLNAPWH